MMKYRCHGSVCSVFDSDFADGMSHSPNVDSIDARISSRAGFAYSFSKFTFYILLNIEYFIAQVINTKA